MRQGHRWVSLLIAAPFLVVLLTGILLQLKKELPWVQPPSQKAPGRVPQLSWEALLEAAKSQTEAGIQGWADIQRIDVQPGRGILKVQTANHWEIQMDIQTGKVLHTAIRRSDWIESLHDGSWFHESAKLWVFLPAAVGVLGLWISGIYLFFLPLAVKLGRGKSTPSVAPQQDRRS